MPGLDKVMALIDKLGLKKAAVTNAPRPNAEFMLVLHTLVAYGRNTGSL